MPGNYSFEEYLLLIGSADSAEELDLIGEQLADDRKSKAIDPFSYIRLKTASLLKLTDIAIAEVQEKKKL